MSPMRPATADLLFEQTGKQTGRKIQIRVNLIRSNKMRVSIGLDFLVLFDQAKRTE